VRHHREGKVRRTDIFDLHADVCKTLANPKRLQILALLGKREMSVGELAGALSLPLPNVSQHLSHLRARGLVASRQAGQTVHYRLADRRILRACTLIRSVLLDRLQERHLIAQHADHRSAVAAL
jgi:DNA-binding transcriptional ArsR family regulator